MVVAIRVFNTRRGSLLQCGLPGILMSVLLLPWKLLRSRDCYGFERDIPGKRRGCLAVH